jgi:hypothetical protein
MGPHPGNGYDNITVTFDTKPREVSPETIFQNAFNAAREQLR